MARRLFVRTALALSMLAVALFCPFLSLLMALIGSFLTVNVSLIYPAVLHLKLHQVSCDELLPLCIGQSEMWHICSCPGSVLLCAHMLT